MAEACPGTSLAKLAWLVAWHIRDESYAKGQIELVHDEAVLTSQPYAWKSGSWTCFLLQVRALTPTSWAVEGKIWPDGQAEPAAWTLATTIDKAPSPGRASLWGVPYGGKPLLFDDLVVAPASAK